MAQLNEEYKNADANAEQTKETYKSYRKKYAATDSELKAEKKAKTSSDERRYRGVPAGTRRFHEGAIPLVKTAIYWADE
jgi:hypothetical protein